MQGRRGREQIAELLQELDRAPKPASVEDFDQRISSLEEIIEKTAEEERSPLYTQLTRLVEERSLFMLAERVQQRRELAQRQADLEKVLKKRQKILDDLDAQPPWISYGAAASASAVSTSIMHPLDTLKVRLARVCSKCCCCSDFLNK